MKRLFIFLLLLAQARASTWFITQAGAGSGNGTSLINACSESNHNAGTLAILPGDTVILHGTFTGTLNIINSGSSGNIITYLFDTGAKFSAAVWSQSTGAIGMNGISYVTINGGATGTIGGINGNPSLANGII